MAKQKALPHKLNWFAKLPIYERISNPAWRHLTKSATDVLIVAIAKSDAAAAAKDRKPGRPTFDFSYNDARRTLNMPPPTFKKALDELGELGFVVIKRPGGTQDGDGIPTLYQLADDWMKWTPPPKDNSNIRKALAAKKAKKELKGGSGSGSGG